LKSLAQNPSTVQVLILLLLIGKVNLKSFALFLCLTVGRNLNGILAIQLREMMDEERS